MSALAELVLKPVLERTALDNAIIFSRHGDIEQAAAEYARLQAENAAKDAHVIALMDEIEMRHGVDEDRWGILRAALKGEADNAS